MQAVVMHETGDPDVLRYEEADRPEPSDGEVLIRYSSSMRFKSSISCASSTSSLIICSTLRTE